MRGLKCIQNKILTNLSVKIFNYMLVKQSNVKVTQYSYFVSGFRATKRGKQKMALLPFTKLNVGWNGGKDRN